MLTKSAEEEAVTAILPEPRFSDVTLLADDGTAFCASKCALAEASAVFAACFISGGDSTSSIGVASKAAGALVVQEKPSSAGAAGGKSAGSSTAASSSTAAERTALRLRLPGVSTRDLKLFLQ